MLVGSQTGSPASGSPVWGVALCGCCIADADIKETQSNQYTPLITKNIAEYQETCVNFVQVCC